MKRLKITVALAAQIQIITICYVFFLCCCSTKQKQNKKSQNILFYENKESHKYCNP